MTDNLTYSALLAENDSLKNTLKSIVEQLKNGTSPLTESSDLQSVAQNRVLEHSQQQQLYQDHLEILVKERTTALSNTIKKLESEMAERLIAEAALRESERKYRELIECANTIILRLDKNGTITFFNEYAQNFFGFTHDEIIGKAVGATILPHFEEETGRNLIELMDDIYQNPEIYCANENENIKKSGERVWIAWNNRPIYNDHGEQTELLCIGTDVTERKKAEMALRESEHKYRFMFEDSPAGSIIVDTKGILLDVNKTFCSALGYTREDLIGKKALDYIAREQLETVSERLVSYFNGETRPEMDVKIYAKDGSFRITRFSGKTVQLFENGAPYGILLTGVDVTTRVQMEELKKNHNQRLIQTDKMATLGILVSGVAHEINNPNNFILLNSNNLFDIWCDLKKILDQKSVTDGDFFLAGLPYSEVRDEVGPLIQGISEGAERIKRIVQSLKDFARKDPGNLDEKVTISAAIETSVLILNNIIKKSTNKFTLNISNETPCIRGNLQQIEQVIINLITNACQALTETNQAIIVSSSFDSELQRVIIEVYDEGKGISPENLKHIFDPFFTTKRDSGGTGLGLSICYQIVKDHQGELQFESTVNKGTIARLILPVSSCA